MDEETIDNYKEHDIAVYGGYLRDSKLVEKSSSGGIATALAKKVISEGGYVAGVVYSSDCYSTEYLITNNVNDIERFRGAKYSEVNLKGVFKDVKLLLQNKNTVLFFGTPCMTAALKKYCCNELSNLILCEMVCHGPVSKKVHEEYIHLLETRYKSKVVQFTTRYKKDGRWTPKYLMAKFKNNKIVRIPFNETEYGIAFAIMGLERCYKCRFKGNARQGDIMLGDFWGAKAEDLFWNENGVSVIFAETEKGNKLLLSIDDVKLYPTTFERAIKQNPMVIRPRTKHELYDRFKLKFDEEGLQSSIRESVPLKNRLKARVKHILINL